MASKYRDRGHTARNMATVAAATVTTTALAVGLAAPAQASQAVNPLITPQRAAAVGLTVSAEEIPVAEHIAIYTVGPYFENGDVTYADLLLEFADVLGDQEITDTMTAVLQALGNAPFVIESGAVGPLPSDVYDAVNGLDYTPDEVLDLLEQPIRGFFGDLAWTLFEAVLEGAPVLNQRRAVIFSEGLGAVTTSQAYRDMIDTVQSDDPDWDEGVTGMWLVMLNNPSRPGGGLFALATPFTEAAGLNLTTPDAGSYTNGDITKMLNTSVLDITAAYNPMSDAPTTLNPLAWANSLAAAAFPSYMIPRDINNTNIDDHVVPQLSAGVFDGSKVMLDLSGGQGLEAVPAWHTFVDIVGDHPDLFPDNAADTLNEIADSTKVPGKSTYITYDSGNLPILEPSRMLARQLGAILGVHIPTPIADSIEDALRILINTGYQDVNPETFERS